MIAEPQKTVQKKKAPTVHAIFSSSPGLLYITKEPEQITFPHVSHRGACCSAGGLESNTCQGVEVRDAAEGSPAQALAKAGLSLLGGAPSSGGVHPQRLPFPMAMGPDSVLILSLLFLRLPSHPFLVQRGGCRKCSEPLQRGL